MFAYAFGFGFNAFCSFGYHLLLIEREFINVTGRPVKDNIIAGDYVGDIVLCF